MGRLRSSKVGPPSSAEEYDRGRVILADSLAAATPNLMCDCSTCMYRLYNYNKLLYTQNN